MRKVLSLLLLAIATIFSNGNAYAADPDKALYDAAMAAITDGGTYHITTEVEGTKFYLAANGALTSVAADACIYTLQVATGGGLYNEGINITGGNGHYSNTTLSGDLANLKPGTGVFRQDGGNDRNDWERQVFYLDEAGKYAIRSCNVPYGESSWNDAGRAFWTYEVKEAQPDPCYTYEPAFVWNLEGVIAVTVTYQLVETDGTAVSSVTKKQVEGSEVIVPASLLSNIAYSYDYEGGTVGNEDCTITITRTPKKVVSALDELSNAKSYKIACDRGRLLTKNGYLASTAHGTLTNAEATEFAVISYKDNYYLYSVADQKFVTNTGALAAVPTHREADAVQMEDMGSNYFMFYFNMENGQKFGLNTNGNDPYGYVINDWMTADPGNKYYMVEEADFDATDALFALDNIEYVAAMASITDGGTYRIVTEVEGTKFYLAANGALTSDKAGSCIYTLNKSTGGGLYNEGIEIAGGNGHFSNTTLSGDKANLKPGTGVYRQDGGNNRNDWERQVFFQNAEGLYAIRSCNVPYGESSWNDAGRAFWTYEVADAQPDPCYTYDMAYLWQLETVVTLPVTYQLVEADGTVVSSVTQKQEAGSLISVPASLMTNFAYDYTYPSGAIGDEACTINVTRTPKPGYILALGDLSNAKTYKITCDRGKFLTKDGYLASTAHNTLTSAEPSEFAVLRYGGNYYLYSVADQKFVTNTGELAEMPVHGTADAVQIEARDGWAAPYFMFYFNMPDGQKFGLNTNGNDPYGYVINSWMTADPGNMYYMVEEAEFDATEILKALDDKYYEAAMAAIENGGNYRIVTNVNGTKYYVATNGALTSTKGAGAIFTLNKSTGGGLYNEGIEIAGADGHFSNTTLLNDMANLHPGTGVFRQDGGNNRNDWERQVFFMDGGGKVAIRSCNTPYGETSWNDAGRAFWTYEVADAEPDPCYTYEAAYIWQLESVSEIVNVTYQLYESDGTTKVGNPQTVKQEAGDDAFVPSSMSNANLYDYEIQGTIGSEDCEIAIIRTFKAGVVMDLADLTDEKAYLIRCDRGALLTKDGYLASTAHNTLTGAKASQFAVITYEGNYYLYSVADKMFVTNTGALAATPTHGTADAIQIEARDGWAAPYFMYFFNMENGEKYGLNTNGNDPYGYVINSWMTADPGNMYYMVEEADFDAADALKALDSQFHPTVTIGEAGYATLYLPFAVTLGEGATAYTGKINEESLTLAPLTSGVPANTAVVVKGAPGTYELTVGDKAITCAKAVELTSALEDNTLSEEVFTVEGFITSTDSKISRNQQVFWMADTQDGGNVFEAYWANLADGRKEAYEVGSKVRITGKLQKYVKNGNVTCEIKNADVDLLDNDLKGTFVEIAADGKYVLAQPEGKEVGFYKAEGTIPAGKAYLEAQGAEVKGFAIVINGGETAIEGITTSATIPADAIYDLSGRRVEKATKGIYIINGKKVLK